MNQKNSPIRFGVLFISLFLLFYYFNILFFGITSPGNHYIPFLADHLNYIAALRGLLLQCSAGVLQLFGFTALTNNYELLVVGRGVITLVYSCLGLGVMSFFTAFVLAYPKPTKPKLIFLISGLLVIQLLNIIRFALLALFWHKPYGSIIDHHTLFNALIYIVISISLYFWVTTDASLIKQHGKN
jgi:exosortase/archaeosortase family protein